MASRGASPRANRLAGSIAAIIVVIAAADCARAQDDDETDLAPYFETLGGPARLAEPPRPPTITARELIARLEAHGLAPAPPARPMPPSRATSPAPGMAAVEDRILSLINAHRASRRLEPVRPHSGLAARARTHAAAVAAGTEPFDHSGFRSRVGEFVGGIFGYSAAGEVLAGIRRPAEPAAGALASWRASPVHRGILEGDYTRVGIGVGRAPDGTHYVTALFLR